MIPRCSHLIDSTGLRGIQDKLVTGGGFFLTTVRRTEGKQDIFLKEIGGFGDFQRVTESLFSHDEV